MKRAVLAAVVLLLAAAAPAEAWLALGADASRQPGWIGFYVVGTDPFAHVEIAERVGGADLPLRSVVPPFAIRPNGSVFSAGYYPDVVKWRCDRVTRSFTAVGVLADGLSVGPAAFDVLTPSCRNRLALIAPRRARPGATVRVRVRDAFELGDVSARVCVRAPGGVSRCRVLRLVGTEASMTFITRRGHSVVSLTAPYEHVHTVVSAGIPPPPRTAPLPVVLATGDSMMQSVDAQLSDLLVNGADVRSDVHIGSGFSFDGPVAWSALPERQMQRFHPDAAVLFIGANDDYPMTTPSGAVVQCCGEPYIAEYARRIRRATHTYLRHGGKAVVWLNVPAMADPRRNPSIAAVDVALNEAVAGINNARVLDMAGLFTPGGVYRSTMKFNGRSVRVRESDGVHLTPQGAAIAAGDVVTELELLHVI